MTVRDPSTTRFPRGRESVVVPPVPGAAEAVGVRVVHDAVPGRVRLSVPALKRNSDQARRLEEVASGWFGVTRVTANEWTGNVLLTFDPAATSVEPLVVRVRAEAARPAVSPSPPESARPGPTLEPSVPPPPRPRTRAIEAGLGSVGLLAAGAALWAVRAHGHNLALDQVPLAFAEEVHNPPLTALMRGASRLVEPSIIWPITIAATAMGVGRRAPGELPWLAPVAVLGGGALVTVLKTVLRRGRPTAFEHLSPVRGYSLPSGHAFLAVCLYGLLAHHAYRWLRVRQPGDRRAAALLLVGAAAVVLLVGVSRVYLGVHYPTDVIAGYALALLWLFFLAALNDRPRPPLAA